VAEFIAPVVDWLIGVLQKANLGDLPAFGEVKQSWTGVVVNWPPAAVMPRNTGFDPEGQARRQVHRLTVKFGVNGADPNQVAADAMSYMKAIDAAIGKAVWPADTPSLAVTRVFVAAHDYGALWTKEGGFAKFPELHLEVEVTEL
jgi:hypothetical protein